MSSPQLSALKPFIDVEIPTGCNILIIGPPGVGKTTFCESLLHEWLVRKGNNLYFTLDNPPIKIIERLQLKERSYTLEGSNLLFVDGYSWLVGEATVKYRVTNLSNLSDLSVKMLSASNQLGEAIFFIFDSISTLIVYNSETEVVRFLEVNMARMKHSNNLGFWVVEQGIHTESFYNSLRHIADSIIEMRFNNAEDLNTRLIRMHTFKGLAHRTKWFPFTIQSNGRINIKS